MKKYEKIYKKLREQYTDEEIADSMLIPEDLSEEEEERLRKEFVRLRMQRRQEMSEKDKILSGLLSIKYQISSYVSSRDFSEEKSFGSFVEKYMEIIDRKQKDLAEEIDIHPSRLNRIIKGKEKIGKSIAYRLETHSGEIIPAIFWWKLMQKEVEQEILTEKQERELERKHVKKIAYEA